MRVVLANQFFVPDSAATAQLVADLGDYLLAHGHEVHVIASVQAYSGGQLPPSPCPRLPASACPPNPSSITPKPSFVVHRLWASGFGRSRLVGRLIDYASFCVLALWKALWLPRPAVCVCLTTPPFISLVGMALRFLKGTRVVLWTMDLYPQVPVAFGVLKPNSLIVHILARLSRWTYRKASLIVSLGEMMTQRLIEAGAPPERIITVHNWVPRESVTPLKPEETPLRKAWKLNGQVTVMYSGNLGLGHELDTVVRAFARLASGSFCPQSPSRRAERQTCLTPSLLFVGTGQMREPLERLTIELRLPGVSFRPPVPLNRLSESLAVGDIHLVSQKPGTQGIIVPSKIYGVLAAGRPTIFVGPEDCEPAQIIRASGAGLIVPPGDVDAVAAAIRKLAGDEALRCDMGRKARAYYETHFGRDRSVSRIVAGVEALTSS